MFAQRFAPAAAALLISAGASAQVGVTADLGTTGVGAHLVVPMESNLNGRFGANYFQHDFSKTSGAVKYQLDGKLQTVDLLFDLYPRTDSDFRLTAGLVYNGNKFDGRGVPQAGRFTLNGHSFSAAEVGILEATVEYRKAAPYVGIGWGNALRPARDGQGGWRFNADAGFYYMGNANVRLVNSGCGTIPLVCLIIAHDVTVESVKLQDEASKLKVFPVLRGALSYSF